jgi:hypothetical protein
MSRDARRFFQNKTNNDLQRELKFHVKTGIRRLRTAKTLEALDEEMLDVLELLQRQDDQAITSACYDEHVTQNELILWDVWYRQDTGARMERKLQKAKAELRDQIKKLRNNQGDSIWHGAFARVRTSYIVSTKEPCSYDDNALREEFGMTEEEFYWFNENM